jgi:osmoprotectant transport system substrate-binding protein
MRHSRMLALGAALLVLTTSACGLGGSKPAIKIGSVGFDEARVMAEVYAVALEAEGYQVDRAGIGLGQRPVVAPAIESGQIDLQPEYIGSRLAYEGGTATGDAATTFTALNQALANKQLTALQYSPGVDGNAFVVRRDTAENLNLSKMSDLAAVQGEIRWGLPTDCPTNPVCGAPGGALEQYGITQDTISAATLLSACDTPMADALRANTIDIAELCSTQPDIVANDWVVLEDDLKTQPPENVAPIVRNDYLAKLADRAAFENTLNEVSAAVDTATLADLYKQVTVDRKDPKTVANEWLRSKGFIQ